ncbi:hypothetical protein CC80DRAFT_286077 [Byssothecium circinans]|uniref:Uncharacterized protein n=1 Tax=Byssothecium circinans TaxID=147558 RepID=A0A6A5U622_9PLEO|nr:hypothetical protein CC80DRAFT_286077 [Byssothecium circinans]
MALAAVVATKVASRWKAMRPVPQLLSVEVGLETGGMSPTLCLKHFGGFSAAFRDGGGRIQSCHQNITSPGPVVKLLEKVIRCDPLLDNLSIYSANLASFVFWYKASSSLLSNTLFTLDLPDKRL